MVDLLVLGRELPEVHRLLDHPAALRALGPRHRLLLHDPVCAALAGLAAAGAEGAASALLHVLVDLALPGRRAYKGRRRASRGRWGAGVP